MNILLHLYILMLAYLVTTSMQYHILHIAQTQAFIVLLLDSGEDSDDDGDAEEPVEKSARRMWMRVSILMIIINYS